MTATTVIRGPADVCSLLIESEAFTTCHECDQALSRSEAGLNGTRILF
jgi:hypothetical protein